MNKLVYELSLTDNFLGEGKIIVFHIKGDVHAFDSMIELKNIKKGNPIETIQSFIDHCKNKCKAYGIKLIINKEVEQLL